MQTRGLTKCLHRWTRWSRNTLPALLKGRLSNPFSWMKICLISLKYVSDGPVNKKSALVQKMVWCGSGMSNHQVDIPSTYPVSKFLRYWLLDSTLATLTQTGYITGQRNSFPDPSFHRRMQPHARISGIVGLCKQWKLLHATCRGQKDTLCATFSATHWTQHLTIR